VILDGHPGSAIVTEAREMTADLVVVGSRGHGTIESMLLGSVSRHVASHAECSVLVARSPRLRSVLFATDGSESARVAEQALATWPMFADTAVRVISVAQTGMPTAIGGVPGLYDQVMEQYEEDVDKARLESAAEADAAARRLTEAGLRATSETGDGDPAGEIVRAAVARGSDLIVTGTHGRTGLSRLLLGSVAGNVAGHATASVLIVRAPAV
jgi:nucleotide-binding universal stress UspA family protein